MPRKLASAVRAPRYFARHDRRPLAEAAPHALRHWSAKALIFWAMSTGVIATLAVMTIILSTISWRTSTPAPVGEPPARPEKTASAGKPAATQTVPVLAEVETDEPLLPIAFPEDPAPWFDQDAYRALVLSETPDESPLFPVPFEEVDSTQMPDTELVDDFTTTSDSRGSALGGCAEGPGKPAAGRGSVAANLNVAGIGRSASLGQYSVDPPAKVDQQMLAAVDVVVESRADGRLAVVRLSSGRARLSGLKVGAIVRMIETEDAGKPLGGVRVRWIDPDSNEEKTTLLKEPRIRLTRFD